MALEMASRFLASELTRSMLDRVSSGRSRLLRDLDLAGRAEPEIVLGRLGQVELAVADVWAAVDHLDADLFDP